MDYKVLIYIHRNPQPHFSHDPQPLHKQLTKLQEHVPSFPPANAMRQFADEVGRPVGEAFAQFEETPLASGSLGQVHLATLHDGTRVAVKIRRPGN